MVTAENGCLAIRLLDVDEEPLLDCRPRAPSGPCMAAIGGGAHPLPPSVAASLAPPIPHNGGAATTPTAALSVPPPRPSTSSSPRWSCRQQRGTAAPDSFRSTHCQGGARHMAALASCGARWRRPTRAALALCKGPAAALGPGDGDGPPRQPHGRGAGGVKWRTEGRRRPQG